ncbi:hypothetical protein R5R35_001697 [Gryllus longicercus]|uniref:SAND domain-containing protein n=1 Tax=Gryllus longicercus TaxID=2509291 RepID=A0AAN9V609_9ORTH
MASASKRTLPLEVDLLADERGGVIVNYQELAEKSPAAKEQNRYSEFKKLEIELRTERDARLLCEGQLEEIKKEKDRMETKKDEDIKRLQAMLCEGHVPIEDDFVKQTNTYSTDQQLKIIELREIIKCLDEKCANLTDKNCKLSEKVTSLEYQLSDWKSRSKTWETNYLDAQQKIDAQDRECFLLEQELAEAKERTVVSNKVDNDTSVELDYSDIIESLCPNENLESTVVDVLLQEKLQKISELEDKVESLESLLSQKAIELSEKDNKITRLSVKVQEYNVNIDDKLKEIKVLNNKIDSMKREQERLISDLRRELSNVQKQFAGYKENVANILQKSESDIILNEQFIKDLENGIEEISNILDGANKLLHEQLEHASSLEKQLPGTALLTEAANLLVLPVTCKNTTAELHKDRLVTGSRGRCVKLGDKWYTPIEFEALCGLKGHKHWKRSIRFGHLDLEDLQKVGILSLHPRSCSCSVCCDDDSAITRSGIREVQNN